MSDERWLPVVGHEGRYEVSDLGRVRSVSFSYRNGNGGLVTTRSSIKKTGRGKYAVVGLSNVARAHIRRLVHQLVLEAFVGPKPAGWHGRHKDGNPRNNALSNLRWDTPAGNSQDAMANGEIRRGEGVHGAVLTAAAVLAIRADRRRQKEIAAAYGVTPSNISRIKSRDVWNHI